MKDSHVEVRGLWAAVSDALAVAGFNEVGIEVTDQQVVLSGWIHDVDRVARIICAVVRVAPDAELVDHMHVGRPN